MIKNSRVLLFNIDNTLVDQQLNIIFPVRSINCTSLLATSAKQIKTEQTARCFLNTIKQNITDFTVSFFGSGDFHHLTLMILQQMQSPFFIIMFDRHYDVGPRRFKNHANLEYHCGSWLYSALQLEQCQGCLLVGPQSNRFTRWMQSVSYLEQNFNLHVIEAKDSNNVEYFTSKVEEVVPSNCKIYTTIDKDVLHEDVVETDWGSGDLTESALLEMLTLISNKYKTTLTGVDVCGDPYKTWWFLEEEYPQVLKQHANLNRKILKIFYSYLKNPYESNGNSNTYSI